MRRCRGARSVGDRVRIGDDEILLADYRDGVTDVALPELVEAFRKSGKIGSFPAVHPPFTFHLAEIGGAGATTA